MGCTVGLSGGGVRWCPGVPYTGACVDDGCLLWSRNPLPFTAQAATRSPFHELFPTVSPSFNTLSFAVHSAQRAGLLPFSLIRIDTTGAVVADCLYLSREHTGRDIEAQQAIIGQDGPLTQTVRGVTEGVCRVTDRGQQHRDVWRRRF